MKILLLSYYFEPDLSAGSFRSSALYKRLKNLGHEVEVITTLPNRYNGFEGKINNELNSDSTRIFRIDTKNDNSKFLAQIRAYIKFFFGALKITKKTDYDIVYASSSKLFTAFLGAVISKRNKSLLYLDIRDIFLESLRDIFNPFISFFLLPILSIIERYTFNHADHINLVSEGFESYFTTRYKGKSISFYTNGIDKEFLDKDFEKKKNLDSKITILYAGNIGDGQGLEKIVPSLAKDINEKYEFHIYGDGSKKEILKNKCRTATNVKFFDPVTRNDLLARYADCDILFLHLNDLEAFKRVIPSKIFEYASTGKPILAGVDGYPNRFIKKNIINSYVFASCDQKDALQKLRNIDLRIVNREEFKNKFSREIIIAELANSLISLK